MIYIISLGYNNEEIMRKSLTRMFDTVALPRDLFCHIILDQYYPTGRDRILKLFHEMKTLYGSVIMDAGENKGLNGGWNWVCDRLPLAYDDILIGYDPDSWPREAGWGEAIVQALKPWQETKVPWVSLTSSNTYAMPGATFATQVLNKINTISPTSHPCWMQSVCGFVAGPLLEIGNFQGPAYWYGELEKTLHVKYKELGYEMAWLKDWWDDFKHLVPLEDPRYTRWKVMHALENTVKVDFATWLKESETNTR